MGAIAGAGHVKGWVREALRLTPARPNIAAGLRGAVATTLPLLLIPWLDRPELAWTSLAGFSVVLVDKGGAYRTRALSMFGLCATGALSVLLGTLLAAHPVPATALVVLVVGLGAFSRLFGAEATSVGVSTCVTLVVALSRPADGPASALRDAGFFVLGALWAALLSLVLCPLRPFRPARLAVAGSLRELARVADSIVAAPTEPTAQVARREQLGRTRQSIEHARRARRLAAGRLCGAALQRNRGAPGAGRPRASPHRGRARDRRAVRGERAG